VYWSFPKVKDSKTGKEKVVPFIKYYTVFNVEQCDGLNIEQRTERIFSPVERIANCEELLSKIEPKPVIQHKEARAYYLGGNSDFVNMPVIESFDSPENYYAVLFHELGHWTGHNTRLNRDMSGSFGSTAYAKEELCAEMTANFLISETGIQLPEENTIAYLQSWITTLKNDVTLLVRASSLAQKASDFLLGRTESKADESTETESVAA
jgi:antirestriction protein ArdC